MCVPKFSKLKLVPFGSCYLISCLLSSYSLLSDIIPCQGEKQESLKEELEEIRREVRQRSLGVVKFMGELFKLKMLTEGIIDVCIVSLLQRQREESLECLCVLLSSTGKNLDNKKVCVCVRACVCVQRILKRCTFPILTKKSWFIKYQ